MSTLFSHFSLKINQISPLETNFTEVLESIALKPKTLYFYGKMPKNVVENGKNVRQKAVAVVGSRHNTHYGEEVAYKLAYELAKNGVIIISGLAFGIDSIAHRAALDAGGKTIAILGTPINEIYPRAHESLAREIIEKDGAIISEYAPNENYYPKSTFLKRNRLISGLSDAVVVVEAANRSGTLNTAAHALNQGKDVYAVPGNITNPYSVGCNNLLKQGAIPYTEPNDLLFQLFPQKRFKPKKLTLPTGGSEEETKILKALGSGLKNGEAIMERLNLSTAQFNELITLLEIKGLVRSLSSNNWTLT